jgi:uncharacterized protein
VKSSETLDPRWRAVGQSPTLRLRPRGARHLLVLAHGAGAGMHHEFMTELADALGSHGVATLRYEFPYMAAGNKRVDSPEVCHAAVRDAVATRTTLNLFAGGKSFGGRMTSQAHALSPLPVRGLVFFGFPLHPPDKPGIERAEHLARATGPLLFLSGARDDFAQMELLRPVVRGLGDRATLHVIDGADHGFTRPKGVIDELARTTAAWMDRVSS